MTTKWTTRQVCYNNVMTIIIYHMLYCNACSMMYIHHNFVEIQLIEKWHNTQVTYPMVCVTIKPWHTDWGHNQANFFAWGQGLHMLMPVLSVETPDVGFRRLERFLGVIGKGVISLYIHIYFKFDANISTSKWTMNYFE